MRPIILIGVAWLTACGQTVDVLNHRGGEGTKTDNIAGVTLTPKSEQNGVVVASFDPASKETQVVKASATGAVRDARISIPAGALGIATDLSIGEGAAIVDASVATDLGLDAGVTLATAGPAVVITSSTAVDATVPFTIALPVGAASLRLTDGQNLVVVYRVVKAAEGGALALGVIPTGELTVNGSTVEFKTTHFGAFQVAYASQPIQAAKEVATAVPIASKGSATELTGKWAGPCHSKDDGKSGETETLLFGDADMTFSHLGYEDAACTKPGIKVEMYGAYKIGAATAVSGVKMVDVTFNKHLFTPLSQTFADLMNKNAACTFTDWKVGVGRAVDYSKCKDFFGKDDKQQAPDECPDNGPPDPGTTIYSIFKIEGTALKLGRDAPPNCGKTGETRNVELDDEVMNKVN